MTISVIIPTLNEEQALERTLADLPSSPTLETIIVDGGSTDRTLAIANAFCAHTPQARLVRAPTGRARQMNEGAKASRGDVLLFLHADTQMPNEAPRIIESALADPAIVGGRFDVRFATHSGWGRIISTLMNWRSRTSGIATGDQSIFVRRRIFEHLGGFADIPLMEDIEFSRRLNQAGSTVALRQRVITSFRRWEQQGPLRTILLMWTLRFLYWAGVNPHRLTDFYKAIR
ncbi:MAG: TIGR04283 family arsenosugar biosynthesis glycosyltransferase [Nitrospira sp.]|nr:TIGR04283 family arsenosugar biosynthesis glycosyltransferase [Nitrospira sp.]